MYKECIDYGYNVADGNKIAMHSVVCTVRNPETVSGFGHSHHTYLTVTICDDSPSTQKRSPFVLAPIIRNSEMIIICDRSHHK